jgi:hypothetical protein
MGATQSHPTLRQARPSPVRVYAFLDGLNLFNWVKRCFHYDYPNYDVAKLARSVVNLEQDRNLIETRFYVGTPSDLDDPKKNAWWNAKLAAMGRSGVRIVRRYLKRRELKIHLEGLVNFDATIPRLVEKGIDLALGLDLVRLARSAAFDAAIVFSQDGDLVEAVEEVHKVATEQNRWIQVECAYPVVAGVDSRPIKRTVLRQILNPLYDACIDHTDYR